VQKLAQLLEPSGPKTPGFLSADHGPEMIASRSVSLPCSPADEALLGGFLLFRVALLDH
jgi:hypothetical protein